MPDKIFFYKRCSTHIKIKLETEYDITAAAFCILLYIWTVPRASTHLSWQTQCIQAKSVTEMLRLSIVSTIIITIIISMNNNNNCCTEKRAAGATVLPICVPLYHQVIPLCIYCMYIIIIYYGVWQEIVFILQYNRYLHRYP